MMFKKYRIVIFRDRTGNWGHLHIPGWLVVLLGAIFMGSLCTAAYFWFLHSQTLAVGYQLQEAEKKIQNQNAQILAMAGKLQDIQEDLRRVQLFDSKLKIMMHLDKEPLDTATTPESTGFSVSGNVPLYRQELLARNVHSLADQIAQDLRMEEINQQELIQSLRSNRDFMVITPSIWPTEGHLTSHFGYRVSPFTGVSNLHAGIDISNRIGTPVIAPARGKVTFSGTQNAYGLSIVLEHGNGITTRYAHLSKSLVTEGQTVNRGDVIGAIGNTGRSTGPHLHYEVRIGGVPVNPMRYILN